MCTHVYESGKVQTKNFCAGRFKFLEAKGRENCMNIDAQDIFKVLSEYTGSF